MTPCTRKALGFFNALRAPAILTPGDNDWTDCDRPSNGGFNSRERLDHERQVFFSTPFSLGQHRLRQEVQSTPLCLGVSGATPCVENRRWTYGGVTFATLNVQGSCNNLCDTAPDPDEWAARNAANIAWMQETFAVAKARGSAAVMSSRRPIPAGTCPTDPRAAARPKDAGRDRRPARRLPGLSGRAARRGHRLPEAGRLRPRRLALLPRGQAVPRRHGQRLENFTRVETFGDNQANGTNDVNWLKVTVDARSREVFSFQPQIVPGNRVAVPAP